MILLPCPFVFLRHGETDWNRQRRAMGQSDLPLNATGRAQAAAARDLLRGTAIGAVYSSPLQRARDTAAIVNGVLQRPLIEIPDLAEVRWGIAQGRERGDWEAAWRAGAPIDGAESFAAFLARGLAAINAVLADARRFAAPPLIVAHGGIYWAIDRALGAATPGAGGGDIGNAQPLRHSPPRTPDGTWTVAAIGS
ncbi:MAG: histidine phosphatase family protein [Azospirillaceae bacterium]|nr:histidine phosphatase family protein [Azospirillaceae bacterium]